MVIKEVLKACCSASEITRIVLGGALNSWRVLTLQFRICLMCSYKCVAVQKPNKRTSFKVLRH